MAEDVDRSASNASEENIQFLRLQVLLSQGFALGLAQELGMTPEEAGRRFWQGIASGRPPRAVSPAELERIAHMVADVTRLIYGNAVAEPAGTGWRIIAALGEDGRRALERWGISLEYAVRWFAEIQRHEGEQILTHWSVRLDGDRIIQELNLRG